MTAKRHSLAWSDGAAGPALSPIRRGATHCINGHEFTPANTYWYKGRRMCVPCREARRQRSLAVRKAARQAAPPVVAVPTLKLAGPYQVTGWRARGACRTVDPELFFPKIGVPPDEAKAVCAGCPVREACLRFALSLPPKTDLHGVFGGLTPSQRKDLRRQAGRGAVTAA